MPDQETPYPLQEIAAQMRAAGWHGKGRAGWLFMAHVAAEAERGVGPVVAQMKRSLGLEDSLALNLAAAKVEADCRAVGARSRHSLRVAEAAIDWIASQPRKEQSR